MNQFASSESAAYNLKDNYDDEDKLSPLQKALKQKREQMIDNKVGEKNPFSGDRTDKDPVD